MDPATATSIGGVVAAFLGGAYGYFQNRKAATATELAINATASATRSASDDLAKSQSELLASFQQVAADWKGQYETKNAELLAYREYVHEKAKEEQKTLLRLTEENADLRARTDLTPIMDQLKAQSRVNEELGATLGKLTEAVTILLARISQPEPNIAKSNES